jgi:hypothetical protein
MASVWLGVACELGGGVKDRCLQGVTHHFDLPVYGRCDVLP